MVVALNPVAITFCATFYAKTEINWDFQTTLYMWILESGRFNFVFVKIILRVSDDKYTRLIRQGQTENKGKMHDTT